LSLLEQVFLTVEDPEPAGSGPLRPCDMVETLFNLVMILFMSFMSIFELQIMKPRHTIKV